MPAAWLRAVAWTTALAVLVSGLPACVTLEAASGARTPAAEGAIVLDLVGVRGRSGERPEGLRVRVRRLDTDQDMFVFTEKKDATHVEHLPPGRYRVRVEGERLGAGGRLEADLEVRSGEVVHVLVHDGLKDVGHGVEVVVNGVVVAVEYILIGALVVGLLWLAIGAPGLEGDRRDGGPHRR